MAIFDVIHFIQQNTFQQHTINIYTDCKLILQYLSFDAYPKYNNTRVIMQTIFKLLTIIQKQKPKLHIKFKKVKSHKYSRIIRLIN